MKLLDKIKDEYVKQKYGFDYSHPFYEEKDLDEIAKRYAKAVLERAAENARMETVFTKNGERTTINKQSILNTDLE